MIQSQINRNIRLDLADAILLSKAKKDLSFAEIADGTGLAEAFVTAALLGQQALPADAARLVGAKLDLDEDSILLLQMIPLRGCPVDRSAGGYHGRAGAGRKLASSACQRTSQCRHQSVADCRRCIDA